MDAPLTDPGKPAKRERTPGRRYKAGHRSRITNGKALLEHVDHRLAWVRRLRDLIQLHLNDLGGPDRASESEKAIVRRAATLIVELAINGEAGAKQLMAYQRCSNTLRRLLESVGLERRPKDVSPDLQTYLRSKSEGAAQ